jgi:predicted ferric reductase
MKYSYRKGFLWLFIFLLLALIPLGIALAGNVPAYRTFWQEFAVGLGFIALALFGLQFLFSGRFDWVAPSYGMDNIIQYHREIGILAFVCIMAHPLTLLIAEPQFLSYFDPRVNLMRAIALTYVTLAILAILLTSIWRSAFGLSYEKWRLLHGFLALSIVFVGVVHSIQVSHYLEPLWKKIALAAVMACFMYLAIHTRIIRPWLNRKRPYEVLRVSDERGECFSLTLKPIGHRRLQFQPGQFAWITIHDTPFTLQQHPFSIASSAGDETISFTSKILGDFTATWQHIKPGTRAFLEGPFGSFIPSRTHHLFFIMGGIGVTPCMSILRTMRDEKDPRKVILMYANASWEEVTFREELEDISRNIQLRVVHLLEEAPVDWHGEKGLLTEEMLNKYLPEDLGNWMFFICGPGPLMDIAEIGLRNKGVDWRLVFSERFEIV